MEDTRCLAYLDGQHYFDSSQSGYFTKRMLPVKNLQETYGLWCITPL